MGLPALLGVSNSVCELSDVSDTSDDDLQLKGKHIKKIIFKGMSCRYGYLDWPFCSGSSWITLVHFVDL